jgi:hypothetical protein
VYIFYSGGGGRGLALLLRRHGVGNVLDCALVFKGINQLHKAKSAVAHIAFYPSHNEMLIIVCCSYCILKVALHTLVSNDFKERNINKVW